MIRKSTREKQIIKQIIIFPMLLVGFFVTLSFLSVKLYTIPNSSKDWETHLKDEYIRNQKKLIVDESEKIYNLIVEERNELTLKLKDYLLNNLSLLEQNENNYETNPIFMYLNHYGIIKNLIITIDELYKLYPSTIGKVDESNNYLEWEYDGEIYEGYYKFNKETKTVYLSYYRKSKAKSIHRRVVLDKIMKLKFPLENYIFVLGIDGIIYGHHKKELVENPNLKEVDPRRYENLVNIVSHAKIYGNSFLEYETGTKNSPENFEEKISYVIPDNEWGIVIGFGVMKKEIIERIEREKKFRNNLIFEMFVNIAIIVFIYIVLTAIMMYFFGHKIAQKFLEFKDSVLIEKEKILQALHYQHKYSIPKDQIIDDIVPLAILDEKLKFKNVTQKFINLLEIEDNAYHGIFLNKIFKENDVIFTNKILNLSNNEEISINETLFTTFKNNDIWLSIKIKKEEKNINKNDVTSYTLICEEVGEKISLRRKIKEEEDVNIINQQIIINQSKLAAIGTTVDSIAQQWKQPLAVISGEVNLLVLNARKEKTEDRMIDLKLLQPQIEKIEDTIKFLSETIETFNCFYDSTDEVTKIHIEQLIKDTLRILIPSTSTNIYTINYNADENVFVYGVRGLYQQVVLTLIHNAIEAFNQNNIKNRILNITIKNKDGFNICQIEDNAGGIPKDIINRIFDLNFSTKKKDKLGNSGLGLYLAKNVIENKFNKGTISVRNTRKGALFTIKTKNIELI